MAREERVILLRTDIDNSSAVKANAELTKSIAKLKKEQKDLKSKTNGLTTATDKQAQAYVKTDAKLKTLQEDSRKYSKILKDQNKEQRANQKIVTQTNGSINSLRNALNINKDAYRSLTKFERENTAAGKQLLTTIRQQDAQYKKLSRTIGNSQANVGNYGATLRRVAGQLGIFVGAASAIRLIRGSINTVKDFELGVAKLASVLGTTPDKINALTDDAKRLGESTIFAASQVSQLQTEFAKLGFNEDQILSATEATLNLAAATGAELSEAAAIAGATLGGFGLDASQTGRVTDVMAKSFSGSALDLEKFKESMKTAAPAARAVGVSVEETTALLGTLANSGINGSKAGTALKKTFIELNAQGLTMNDAFSQVTTSSDKLGTAVKLVGKLAAPAFLVLAEGTKDTDKLTESLLFADGAAKTMAETQQNTLSGSLKALSSKWEAYILNLNDATNGGNTLTKVIRFLGENLKTMIDFLGTAAITFGLYKAAIVLTQGAVSLFSLIQKGAAVVQAFFTRSTATATVAQKGLNTAMKANPIGLVIAAVVGLISVLSNLTRGLSDAEKAQKAIKKANEEAEVSIASEKVALQTLIAVAKDDTKSKGDRKKAIQELNKISPEYLGNLSLENIATAEGTKLINNYVLALGKKAKATALNNELVRIEEELIKNNNKALTDQVGFFEKTFETVKGIASNPTNFQSGVIASLKGQAKLGVENMKAAGAALETQKEAILKEISKQTTENILGPIKNPDDPISPSGGPKGGGKPTKDSIDKTDLKIARQEIAFKLSLIKDAGLKELEINRNKYNILREDALLNQKLTAEQKQKLTNLYDKEELESTKVISKGIADAKIAEEEAYYEKLDAQFNQLKTLRQSDKENELDAVVSEYEEKYLLAVNNSELEVALALEQAEKIAEIEKRFTDKSIAEEKRKEAIRRQVESTKIQLASDTVGAMKGLLDEESSAYKAFSIAQIGIDTYIAAQKAYSSQLVVGDPTSPIRATLAAAVAVAGGVANLTKIKGFADGTESASPLGFADYTNHTGIITGQGNISPLANGDNMLATIKTGEAILNNKQQGRLNNLLGFDAIKYAVKGYADGTTFTGASQTGAINNNVINNSNINNNSQSQENISYIVDVKDIAIGLENLNVKVKDATI